MKLDKELLEALKQNTELRDVEQFCVIETAGDASAAVGSGAELLAVSVVVNDENGDGFRYLVGLPKGVIVTPHLSYWFEVRR